MKRRLLHALLALYVGLTVLIPSIMVFTAFAGNIDPDKMPFAGLAAMTFVAWWILTFLLFVINVIWARKLAVVPALALLVCMKPFLAFCPLHFSHRTLTEEEQKRSFTLLSYNVYSFCDVQGQSSTDYNRTMHTVLASGADVVCMLEFGNQGPLSNFMPQSQIDSLNTIYPFSAKGLRGTVAFSKSPILHVAPPTRNPNRGSMELFHTVIHGRGVDIFGVHLESIGLNDDDKTLYRDLTEIKTSDEDVELNIGNVRSRLVDKLYTAFQNRASQALYIRDYIEQLGSENVIVCGDFNDVPGCRAMRILEKEGLRDVYSQIGCGPMITYNASHFFFRIDHIMYRGNMTPVSVSRGNVPSSDHYPMQATFLFD